MGAYVQKILLWLVPINLGLSFWVGHRELSASESQIGSEFEAIGLAIIVCAPILAGWGLYRAFPANRSKLRSVVRFLSYAISVLYAPIITWLNIRSVLTGQPLEESFQVYVAPMMFGAVSIVLFAVLSVFCVMFTNKPSSYGGFD